MSTEIKHRNEFRDLDARNWLLPETIEDLAQAVKSHPHLKIGGMNCYRLIPEGRWPRSFTDEDGKLRPLQEPKPILVQEPKQKLLLDNLKQIVSFSPDDQIVTVESGIFLSHLNSFLKESGFEIPIGLMQESLEECVGDMIALNLPHWNMARGGSWRDWVVRMKIVLASGEVVVSGANVVKNVTGFDLHKMMIGARSTLGVIAEVTLRIKPMSSPKDYPPITINHGVLFCSNSEGIVAMRNHLGDFLGPWENDIGMQHYIDDEGGLALVETLTNRDGVPFDSAKYGHIWRSHQGEYALAPFGEADQKLMKRTKEIFDPTNKLNPGEFGFI